MKVHISLNVRNIDESVGFYSKMFSQDPLKFIKSESGAAKTGYAKFDVANPPLNLVLNEVDYKAGGNLSHLGLQVETTDDVLSYKNRWVDQGLVTVDEMGVNCCYAKQDKTWVSDPDGNEWEAFVVLGDLEEKESPDACDCSDKVSEYVEKAGVLAASGCDPADEVKAREPKQETCC